MMPFTEQYEHAIHVALDATEGVKPTAYRLIAFREILRYELYNVLPLDCTDHLEEEAAIAAELEEGGGTDESTD